MIKFKPGKKGYRKNKRTLQWKDYVTKEALPPLPAPPLGHPELVKDWDMLLNDKLGDCVIAAEAHKDMLDNAEGGNTITFSDQDIINCYSAACGYDPNATPNSDGSNPTDNGCDVQTVLAYHQNTGFTDSNGKVHKIDAFLQLDQTNIEEMYQAIYFLATVTLGIQVPQSAEDQFNAGQPWTVVPNSPMLGGHGIMGVQAVGVLPNGNLVIVTWGKLQEMEIDFFNKYVDEAYASLSEDMLSSQGESLEGFDLAQLKQDLSELNSTPVPPTPTPTTLPTYLAADPATGKTGESVNLTAELLETDNNNYIANETVTFSVDGSSIGSAVSDANGKASLAYTITQDAGTYQILTDFAGDIQYESTTGNSNLTVKKSRRK